MTRDVTAAPGHARQTTVHGARSTAETTTVCFHVDSEDAAAAELLRQTS